MDTIHSITFGHTFLYEWAQATAGTAAPTEPCGRMSLLTLLIVLREVGGAPALKGRSSFYDPADLAAMARREMETWEPQPYATLNIIDEYLYHVESSQQRHHVGAASFDHGRGLLYVFEPLADGDKSLIHVWRVER